LLLSCNEPEARRPITQNTTTILSETVEQKKRLIALEDSMIESYIAKDSINSYQTSTNGFWYVYLKKNENEAPTPNIGEEVEIEYDLGDLEGNLFYSKDELGLKKYTIDKEDFINGLQEGIKLMKIGETITFIIPSYRAYGLIGDGAKIGINQTIKSTVTLVTIKQK
jgi:FKBP-type peptidyl-prolyl cis-trans isomerase FkpA